VLIAARCHPQELAQPSISIRGRKLPPARQREAVAEKAQAVLDARAQFMDSGSARVPRAGFGVAPQPPAHPTLPSGATPDGATGTVALPAKTATLAGLYDPLAMGK
jgi:hypothetical protein